MKVSLKIILWQTILALSMGCNNLNKSQKGAVTSVPAGGAIGMVLGKVTGNATLGAILGATVGGVGGAVIGNQMDKQADEMKKALPEAKVERIGEGIVIEFSDKILFGFNRSDLGQDAKINLNNLTDILVKYPDTQIEVQGHTDNKGSEGYNMRLSRRRAAAVAGYLSKKDIPSSRIHIKAFGESAPKYSNDTEDGQAQNRRVAFLISANKKMVADAGKEAEK